MKVLMVEGAQDRRVLPWLVEGAGVSWGEKKSPIVTIQEYEGAEDLLAPGEIETQLKASGLVALGVIVDADESAAGRWASIRQRLSGIYDMLPADLPATGLLIQEEGLPDFGAWIMPDNSSRGMLETFLLYLRPSENESLHQHCETACDQAVQLGAPFREAHRDKALIHSWLAWQDPPGRQLHNAIMEKMLTNAPLEFQRFIDWFRNLYAV